MKYKEGMKLKRKFYNYGTVTIKKIDEKHITVSDNGMNHVIETDKVDNFFEIVKEK